MLTSCFTGERPYFVEEPCAPANTGEPAVDQLIARMFAADATTTGYTARYSVLLRFGNTTTPAAAAIGNGRRSVTIGDVRYLTDDGRALTCTVSTGNCAQGLEPTRVTDTGATIEFYGADAARRLCRDASATLGPSTIRTDTIADQPVDCADLPLPGGTATYCVLASGAVASIVDGDVIVTLDSFAPTIDESLFAETG